MKKSNDFNKGYIKGIEDLSYFLIDKTDSLNELGDLHTNLNNAIISLIKEEKKEDDITKIVKELLDKHKNHRLIPLTKQEVIFISILETIMEIRKLTMKNNSKEILKIIKEFENEQKA